MDFEQLNLKFGPDTKWYKKDKCGWCNKPNRITEKVYQLKGNMCEDCNSIIRRRILNMEIEKEIKKESKEIHDLRGEMNLLGRKLDLIKNDDPELELKALLIKQEMELVWKKIQYQKKHLEEIAAE